MIGRRGGLLKTLVRKVIARLANAATPLLRSTRIGQVIHQEMLDQMMCETQAVEHGGVHLTFCVPNRVNKFRIDTFSTKEPETLEWIDRIPMGATLWDIGANVGLYACYAAKTRGCQVIAFEPSVFNLELLARNIFANALTDKVMIIPLPLSNSLGVDKLNMTTTEWGGALSTFGHTYGHDGHELQRVFEFRTLGVTMADAVACLRLPAPDYIKMDVDGIEHLILRGGESILRNVRQVLIEVNDQFNEQADVCAACLRGAGLALVSKSHSQMFENSAFRSAFNQIWARPSEAS